MSTIKDPDSFAKRLLLCAGCVQDTPDGQICPITGQRPDLYSPVLCETLSGQPPRLPSPNP